MSLVIITSFIVATAPDVLHALYAGAPGHCERVVAQATCETAGSCPPAVADAVVICELRALHAGLEGRADLLFPELNGLGRALRGQLGSVAAERAVASGLTVNMAVAAAAVLQAVPGAAIVRLCEPQRDRIERNRLLGTYHEIPTNGRACDVAELSILTDSDRATAAVAARGAIRSVQGNRAGIEVHPARWTAVLRLVRLVDGADSEQRVEALFTSPSSGG